LILKRDIMISCIIIDDEAKARVTFEKIIQLDLPEKLKVIATRRNEEFVKALTKAKG